MEFGGHSPHSPRSGVYELLAAGGKNLAAAAEVLCGLLAPGADRRAVANRMRELEHAGDAVTHQILRQLNTSFVTHFDREDIYALAGRIDDVMDCLDEAAEFIMLADVGTLPSLIVDQIRMIRRGCRRPPARSAGCARCRIWRATGSR